MSQPDEQQSIESAFSEYWGFSPNKTQAVSPPSPPDHDDQAATKEKPEGGSFVRAFTRLWGFGDAPPKDASGSADVIESVPREGLKTAGRIAIDDGAAAASKPSKARTRRSRVEVLLPANPIPPAATSRETDSPSPSMPAKPLPTPAVISRPAVGCGSRLEVGDLRAVLAGGPLRRKELVAALRERTGCGHSAAYNVVAPGGRLSGFIFEDEFGRFALIGENAPKV